MTLSSGALHDAVSLAPIAPSGMLFAPSIGGRSHCPDEDTKSEDLSAAANVLLHTILGLARTIEA
jgi:N-carbamoyl-L-amino-acid hydrolase